MSIRRQKTEDRPQPQRQFSKKYEEEAIILDVVSPDLNRRKDKYRDDSILQVIGTSWFTLLEIVPEDPNPLMLQDKLTLGKDERSNIQTIIGRIEYEKLTPIAELQLPIAIDIILDEQEKRYVSWLNRSSPISLRLHSLHLIKGIGPKSLKTILDERKVVPFMTYEDFEERTGIGNIKGLLKQRILDEITGEDEKHHLFTRALKKERR